MKLPHFHADTGQLPGAMITRSWWRLDVQYGGRQVELVAIPISSKDAVSQRLPLGHGGWMHKFEALSSAVGEPQCSALR